MRNQTLNKIITQIEKQLVKEQNVAVAVCGGSCTRKSSYVSAFLADYFKENCILLSQDQFQLQSSYKEKLDSNYLWDHPNNFGISECYDALSKLKQKQVVEVPNYNFKKDAPISYKTITPAPVIIFEGLYTNYEVLKNINDISIYVKSPWYARMMRRLFRNTLDRYKGRTHESILESFCNSVTRAHLDFVSSQEKLTDYIVEVPFNFSSIINHYQLEPIHHEIERGEPFFSMECDKDIVFKITCFDEETFEFLFFYDQKLYLKFRITKKLADKLKDIDWLAY